MKHLSLEEFFNVPTEDLNAMGLMSFDEIVINDDNSLSVVLKTQKRHMNYHGTIQGGMQFMICDTAIGAYLIHIGRLGVGMEASIHYFRPAKEGDTLIATVYDRKVGRRTGSFLVELRNQDDKHIADVYYSVMFNEN